MRGVGTGSSCTVSTDDAALIEYLDALPSRGYGVEWALKIGFGPQGSTYEISDEAAKSDPVQTAVKGAPIPKAPGVEGWPRDSEMARYRRSSPRAGLA